MQKLESVQVETERYQSNSMALDTVELKTVSLSSPFIRPELGRTLTTPMEIILC